MMDRIPMTPEGHASLSEELRRLKSVERPEIIRAIEEARAHGDLSENAEYHAAKEAQSLNERRISELEDKLRRAEVIEVDKLSGDKVVFGAWVTLREEASGQKRQFQIVDEAEADVRQGRISVSSPMARAMIRHGVGETIEVVAPAGSRFYEILSVGYGAAAKPAGKPAAAKSKSKPKTKPATSKATKTPSKKAATKKPVEKVKKKTAAKKSPARKAVKKPATPATKKSAAKKKPTTKGKK